MQIDRKAVISAASEVGLPIDDDSNVEIGGVACTTMLVMFARVIARRATEQERKPLSEYEQALQLLAGLHQCPTIDGPPMALAELIFDAVQADQRALKEEIAKQERNLDWMRKDLAKRAHGITQEPQ